MMRTLIKTVVLLAWLGCIPQIAIADSETFYLADSVDDTFADAYYNTNLYTQTYANFGYYTPPTSHQRAFLRYNLGIPLGSTITFAKLRFYGYSTLTGTLDAYILSLTQASSPAWRTADGFSTTNYADYDAINAIGFIAAFAWDPVPSWTANTWYDSPDISTLVQGQIDSPDYTPGDSVEGYVGYKVYRRSTAACSTCYRQFDTYDQGGGNPAELYVEWISPGAQVIVIQR